MGTSRKAVEVAEVATMTSRKVTANPDLSAEVATMTSRKVTAKAAEVAREVAEVKAKAAEVVTTMKNKEAPEVEMIMIRMEPTSKASFREWRWESPNSSNKLRTTWATPSSR